MFWKNWSIREGPKIAEKNLLYQENMKKKFRYVQKMYKKKLN